ncbi:uncharacterized protein LOC110217586 [Phascolarctos cinereus]
MGSSAPGNPQKTPSKTSQDRSHFCLGEPRASGARCAVCASISHSVRGGMGWPGRSSKPGGAQTTSLPGSPKASTGQRRGQDLEGRGRRGGPLNEARSRPSLVWPLLGDRLRGPIRSVPVRGRGFMRKWGVRSGRESGEGLLVGRNAGWEAERE